MSYARSIPSVAAVRRRFRITPANPKKPRLSRASDAGSGTSVVVPLPSGWQSVEITLLSVVTAAFASALPQTIPPPPSKEMDVPARTDPAPKTSDRRRSFGALRTTARLTKRLNRPSFLLRKP